MVQTNKQNVTVSLSTHIIQKARILAAKRSTSISGMLAEQIESLVNSDEAQERASASAISRMERGTSMPTLPTLQRIAAVLDEELLVCFERTVDGEVEREFAAVR